MTNSEIREYIYAHKADLYEQLKECREGNESKEENFRTNYAILLNGLLKALGLSKDITVENEFAVLKGRIDSIYGNFIIEYKYPTRISGSSSSENSKFIEQVQRQITGFEKKTGITSGRIAGVVFDGYYVIYVKRQGADWDISMPQKMTADSHALFLFRLLSISTTGKALTVENLVRDFGASSRQTAESIAAFYKILENNDRKNKARLLYDQWKTLYQEVCGYNFESQDLHIKGLKELYGLNMEYVDFSYLIFSVQTYFALLIKVLSLKILTYLKGGHFKEKNIFHTESQEELKIDLLDMEEGGIYRRLGIVNFLEGDFFGWYLYLWNEDTYQAVQSILESFEKYDYSAIVLEREVARDLLKNLYYELVPVVLRKRLGEFYTPDWLAEFLVDDLAPEITDTRTFLDPTCGSGTFLIILIKKFISAYDTETVPAELLKVILKNVRGYDLNPLAVICARANYIIALGDLLSELETPIEIPVYLCDAMLTILEGYEEETESYIVPTKAETFTIPKKVDYIIGNPPWIDWQNLPEYYRSSIQKYWYDYKVFDHKGQKAQLGSAHDDISVLMTYVIMDNFLKDQGKLAFVINQNLLQASGGGDGFRKFKIKEQIPVCVKSVNDFTEVEPFKSLGVNNKTATIVMQKNEENTYPVVYNKWYKCVKSIIDASLCKEDVFTKKIKCRKLYAAPVKEYNSPWMIATREEREVFDKMLNTDKKSNYRARKGVDTSANAIFWVKEKRSVNTKMMLIDNSPENSRKNIKGITNWPIEKNLLYPLLRGKDVRKWKYAAEYSIVLPYTDQGKVISKENLLEEYPSAYDYFYTAAHQFLPVLTARATYNKFIKRQDKEAPEYSLYNIGEYTFSPYKVIWKALAKEVAAVTISQSQGRMLIPDHNLLMIPLYNEDEAYYITGILNADIVSAFANAYIAWFISGHILERIQIPKFCGEITLHKEIADISREAHRVAEDAEQLRETEKRLNSKVNELLLG